MGGLSTFFIWPKVRIFYFDGLKIYNSLVLDYKDFIKMTYEIMCNLNLCELLMFCYQASSIGNNLFVFTNKWKIAYIQP